ncbi:hypothetical protein PInf_004540 [Phytophthora infestans]|nr:hypothetical protein PInf_004540 [Phytophthora infestans]
MGREEGEGGATPSPSLGNGSRDGGGGGQARRRTPAAVEVGEEEETGDGRDDGVTAVEAVVERGTLTVRDTVETAKDAKRERQYEVAVTKGDTPVDDDEEACLDAVESVSESESEEDVSEEGSTKVLLATFAVMTETTDKSRGVSFPRLRNKPRLGVEPPLKSALRKPLAPTLKDDPDETVVKEVVQEVVEGVVEGEAATVPYLRRIVSDLSMTDGTPEAEYSRLFSDLELEAMEVDGPGEEETILAGVKVAAEKKGHDKELEERLVPLAEVELKRLMKVNAETTKDTSLEEIAKYVEIPEEMLE